MRNLHADEWEIDPIDEADRRACLACRGRQYRTVHKRIKMRKIDEQNRDKPINKSIPHDIVIDAQDRC